MSIDVLLKNLIDQVSELSRKMDRLVSEKSINEDSSYAMALNEAKKGNYKPLQLYSKRRMEENLKRKK